MGVDLYDLGLTREEVVELSYGHWESHVISSGSTTEIHCKVLSGVVT